MKIAVAGCLHGELDKLYNEIEKSQENVDLVLVCGDFQAIRNENDLKCIHVPPKYQRLGTFYQYYFGLKKAPKLTIIIGGNHEASNYFQTLPYGGWIAPNMYYLGYASVVRFGGLRIGGISGIFGKYNHPRYRHDNLGHYEGLPYDKDCTVSAYHMRETEVHKLLQLKRNSAGDFYPIVDIFLSHDWPLNIHNFGNVGYLLNKKPFFRDDIQRGQLGNPLLLPLLEHLKPDNWFAAHLHVGFSATVDHYRASNYTPKPEPGETTIRPSVTKFQALHKTGFYFVQIRHINVPDEPEVKRLEYDPEWLAIVRKTAHLFRVTREIIHDCPLQRNTIEVTDDEIQQIRDAFNNDLTIQPNFEPCDPVPSRDIDLDPNRFFNFLNPQTTELCKRLSIPDPNQMLIDLKGSLPASVDSANAKNPDEIDLGDSDDDDDNNDNDDNTGDTEKGVKKQKLNYVPGLFFEDV